mmetsp:Transcript_41967/g.30798  ORF Transcript_41967/g.30798 Transcript_41967/m.30798 type:complete len:151 (+) Transcript_41967:22-474(+)
MELLNANKVIAQKSQKFTAEELAGLEEEFKLFSVSELYQNKSEKEEQACKAFLGKEPLCVQVTSALNLFNALQFSTNPSLIFDLRPRLPYHMCHLKESINLPLDICDESFFLNWNPERILKEFISNKKKQQAFQNRKRKFIYIVVAQNDI